MKELIQGTNPMDILDDAARLWRSWARGSRQAGILSDLIMAGEILKEISEAG